MFFKYFSRQILFSMTFLDSPVYSNTFQACANPDVYGLKNHKTLELVDTWIDARCKFFTHSSIATPTQINLRKQYLFKLFSKCLVEGNTYRQIHEAQEFSQHIDHSFEVLFW